MNEVQVVTEMAKGISDYGMTVIVGAVYVCLSALMMVAIFKWFKNIIDQVMTGYDRSLKELLEETRRQNLMLRGISEGLQSETLLRTRNLATLAFDLSVEQVCHLIKRVRRENHIEDREGTRRKIRLLLKNLHEDRNSRFDSFTYRGRPISSYCNADWIEKVAAVVESEIYHPVGADDDRARTNVDAIYDDIKLDFYHRLKGSRR